MLAEIEVLLGRAAAAREALYELLDVIPEDYWLRRAEGELWSARNHLEHLATIDAPTRQLFVAARSAASALAPFDAHDVTGVAHARAELMSRVAEEPTAALLERMAVERDAASEALAALDAEHLERAVSLPGIVDAWGRTVSVSLRQYAASWATHDADHTQAIRAAITRPPGPGDLALAARRLRPR